MERPSVVTAKFLLLFVDVSIMFFALLSPEVWVEVNLVRSAPKSPRFVSCVVVIPIVTWSEMVGGYSHRGIVL